MSQNDINAVLAQMRAMAARAQTLEPPAAKPGAPGDFQALMAKALDEVNETQHAAKALAASFERGDENTNIADVMIALQKGGRVVPGDQPGPQQARQRLSGHHEHADLSGDRVTPVLPTI